MIQKEEDERTLTFFLELEISSSSKKRKFTKLLWKSYSVSQIKEDGIVFNSNYDLRSTSKYPPFYFSYVKSYHAFSSDCLQ